MWSPYLSVLMATYSDSLMLSLMKPQGSLLMSDTPPGMMAECPQPTLSSVLKASSLSQPLDTYIIESFSLGSPGI